MKTQRPGFATVDEAAEFLSLSRAMIHKLISDDVIPARRFGRAVRIPWSRLYRQVQCELDFETGRQNEAENQ